MSGIIAIVGQGRLDELAAMAAAMPYRGSLRRAFSPAPGVYLGELSHDDAEQAGDSPLVLDRSGALYEWVTDSRPGAGEIDTVERQRLAAQLAVRGTEALTDASGSFALAFWDAARRRLLLACDRQGFKSLHYMQLPGRRVFATDYKAFLALADCPAAVDVQALQHYLRMRGCPVTASLLQGVQPLHRAHAIEVSQIVGPASTLCRFEYGSVPPQPSTASFAQAARIVRSTLESVLKQQLAGCSRIALTLSGFDSTGLLALTRRIRPDLSIATYTIGHSEQDPEILGARAACGRFGTEHHEEFFDPRQLPQLVPEMVWLTEDLAGGEEVALQYAIVRRIATRDRVVMNGYNADALFAGMPRHKLLWLHDRLPWPLRRPVEEFFVATQTRQPPASWLARRMLSMAYRGDIPAVPGVVGAGPVAMEADISSLWAFRLTAVSDFTQYLEPLHERHGLRMISPFLSPAMRDCAAGFPNRYLIDRSTQKKLLRAALADVLPAGLLARGKSIQRFRHDRALSDTLESFAREIRLSERLAQRGLLSRAAVEQALERGPCGVYSTERSRLLLAIICAEVWLRQFIDARGRFVS